MEDIDWKYKIFSFYGNNFFQVERNEAAFTIACTKKSLKCKLLNISNRYIKKIMKKERLQKIYFEGIVK